MRRGKLGSNRKPKAPKKGKDENQTQNKEPPGESNNSKLSTEQKKEKRSKSTNARILQGITILTIITSLIWWITGKPVISDFWNGYHSPNSWEATWKVVGENIGEVSARLTSGNMTWLPDLSRLPRAFHADAAGVYQPGAFYPLFLVLLWIAWCLVRKEQKKLTLLVDTLTVCIVLILQAVIRTAWCKDTTQTYIFLESLAEGSLFVAPGCLVVLPVYLYKSKLENRRHRVASCISLLLLFLITAFIGYIV